MRTLSFRTLFFITLSFILFIYSTAKIQAAPKPITITDSLGEQSFSQKPSRIVALNWDLAEQLIELNITPVGMPNIKDYHTWVVKPKVPNTTVDLGTRAEPNLTQIQELKPDVILAASPQKDLIPQLEKIAPVLYFESYVGDEPSAPLVIQHFEQIAKLVGQDELAKEKLTKMTQRFSQMKEQINQAFGSHVPPVLPLRFANENSVYLYTENSTTNYVLQQLGLTNPMPQKSQTWGINQKRITELQSLQNAYVLYFGPIDDTKITNSILWQAMPFTRKNHTNKADAVWNYGGAMSLLYIGESITKSLLEIAPKS